MKTVTSDQICRKQSTAPQSGLLATLMPDTVVVAELVGTDLHVDLHPAEEEALGNVSARRRAEFARGRACAHRALTRMRCAPAPLLIGAHREPRWPQGIVGSITHCAGYVGAAIARDSDVATIGIDGEIHAPLPPRVLSHIARPEEAAWLASAPDLGIHWDSLLFSAKESIYKAWSPLTGRWLGFDEAIVVPDVERGVFTARLLSGPPLSCVRGRWLVRGGLILTAVVVPAR